MTLFGKISRNTIRESLPEIILLSLFFCADACFVIGSAFHWKEAFMISEEYAGQQAMKELLASELYADHVKTAEFLNALVPVIAYVFIGSLYVMMTRKKYFWIGMLCMVLIMTPVIGMFINPDCCGNYVEMFLSLYTRRTLIVAAVIAGVLSSLCLTMRQRHRIRVAERMREMG